MITKHETGVRHLYHTVTSNPFFVVGNNDIKPGDATGLISRRSEIIRSNLIWITPAKESCYPSTFSITAVTDWSRAECQMLRPT